MFDIRKCLSATTSKFFEGHIILRMLFEDNIHKEGFCGQYRTKRDFADALDNGVIIALKDTDVLFFPLKVFCLQISTVLNRKLSVNFEDRENLRTIYKKREFADNID